MRKAASDRTATSEGKIVTMINKLEDKESSGFNADSILEQCDETRIKIKKRFEQSWIGSSYGNVSLLISAVSCLQFIYSTYLDGSVDNETIEVSNVMELIFASVFAFDWLLSFFLADHKIIFCTSFFSMVDLLTAVPIFVTYGRDLPNINTVHTFSEAFIYSMFAFRTIRILRALRIRRKLAEINDAVERFLAQMVLSLLVMILFFAAAIQFVEHQYQELPYHTWCYVVWVTIATVGYGDITPASTQGQVVVCCIILVSIILIPMMTNELIEKMALQSVYARAVYRPLGRKSKHVVICGDISSTSMGDFFDELFHIDHENFNLHAILLLPKPPTTEMILLMQSTKYQLSLTYIEGSALVEADLKRARLEEAEAIFIMTNKFSSKPDEEDAKTILVSLSMKRYVSTFQDSPPLFCMQLVRPQNLRHLYKSEDPDESAPTNQLVVCINQIKMGILAKGVMFPGAVTLIMNLISSFNEDGDEDNEDEDDQLDGGDSMKDDTNRQEEKPWLKEYKKGCDYEIYSTELSVSFEGVKFSDLSYGIYDKVGVVLFALQVTDRSLTGPGSSRLLLNPADYVIPNQELFQIEAYVISPDRKLANLTFLNGPSNSVLPMNLMGTSAKVTEAVTAFGGSTINSIGDMVGPTADQTVRQKTVVGKNAPVFSPVRSPYRIVPTSPEMATNNRDRFDSVDTRLSVSSKPKISRAKELWKKLKISYLVKQKVETFSYHEVLHQLQDEYTAENYYLRDQPATLKSITIRTNVIDEVPLVNNHLIIIGKSLGNLLDLIQPIRARYIDRLRYIVILCPQELHYDVWTRIAMFDAILFVKGSALEEKNLRRAGIFRASQVVVLADGSDPATDGSKSSALIDSDAIFAYQCVQRMNPNAQIMLEIVNVSNIKYLNNNVAVENRERDPKDYMFTTQFAGGSLFTSSLLDSLVCQAYYNPSIVKIIRKLLSGVDQLESGDLESRAAARCSEFQNSFNYSSGTKAKRRQSDTESSDSENEDIDNRGRGNRQKYNPKASLKAIRGSCLYQIEVPEFSGPNTYGNLYRILAAQGTIPIGLLRGTLVDMNVGHQQNRCPYVYTNPKKSAIVYKCDRVFVLSTTPLKLSDKLNMKDWLLNLQMQNKGGNSTPGAEESAMDLEKKRRAEQVDLLQKQFDARIDKVSNQINKQMNALIELLEQCRGSIRYAGPTPTTETRRASMESIITSNTGASSEQHNQMLKDNNEEVYTIDSQQPFKHQQSHIEETFEVESSNKSNVSPAVFEVVGQAPTACVQGSLAENSQNGTLEDASDIFSRPKATPLRHLLRDYQDLVGPSIKFTTTPITDKRISRIRSLVAERTRTAPPKIYKILPKLVATRAKGKQESQTYRKARKYKEDGKISDLQRSYSSDEFSRSDDSYE